MNLPLILFIARFLLLSFRTEEEGANRFRASQAAGVLSGCKALPGGLEVKHNLGVLLARWRVRDHLGPNPYKNQRRNLNHLSCKPTKSRFALLAYLVIRTSGKDQRRL